MGLPQTLPPIMSGIRGARQSHLTSLCSLTLTILSSLLAIANLGPKRKLVYLLLCPLPFHPRNTWLVGGQAMILLQVPSHTQIKLCSAKKEPWRDGSTVKSVYCSRRGSMFCSQHPVQELTNQIQTTDLLLVSADICTHRHTHAHTHRHTPTHPPTHNLKFGFVFWVLGGLFFVF